MDNQYNTKNCSVVITQRDDKKLTTYTFTFDDYRTATALINLLLNLDPKYYDHFYDQKEFIPVKVNT